MGLQETRPPRERALLVGLQPPGHIPWDTNPLDELAALVKTADVDVVHQTIQKRARPEKGTYVGTGKVAEIREWIESREHEIDVVIVDDDLTPAQGKTLEKAWGVRVIDRTEVVLDIFASHARTRKAALQVELAQLEYQLPRLRALWTHLSRQAGAGGAAGGVGLRGMGEKQIEVDRRLARKRIADLKEEIEKINARKRREVEKRAQNFTVCLVGYTNAGKSTTMRAVTQADVLVEDKLFSTLDTRTRAWKLDDGQTVLLSDTVGFIRKLPHHLVASFQATLEEALTADLLLHVVDASHEHALEHIESVREVLEQIGAGDIPELMVFNKIDRLESRVELAILMSRFSDAVEISAATGVGLDRLSAAVSARMREYQVEMALELSAGDGKRLAELADKGMILNREYDEDRVRIDVRLPAREAPKWERFATSSATGTPQDPGVTSE
jgi:GTP-binding protein HflX